MLATIVSVLLAIPLGMVAAMRQDTWVDYVVRVVSIGGLAIPSFWSGFSSSCSRDFSAGAAPGVHAALGRPWANFQQMVWPVVTVGYRYAAVTTRMTRSTLLEVLRDD